MQYAKVFTLVYCGSPLFFQFSSVFFVIFISASVRAITQFFDVLHPDTCSISLIAVPLK